MAPTDWAEAADTAQRSLDHYFGAPEPQLLNNTWPPDPASNAAVFNYWWLAHAMEVRLDAYERTGDAKWLADAERTYYNVRTRNGGSLFNDYFDDMLWYALAILRLRDATGDPSYVADAVAIWDHVVEHGWNPTFGASLAWRKQQLYYKNTPANGPLSILSSRLAARTADSRYRPMAIAAFDWITTTLASADGFIEDGINREQDGRIDTQWRFTYNQGLYVGAALELFHLTGERSYLALAERTATTAIDQLARDGVFPDEGDGGDEGLFKGVYYRYAALLANDPEVDPAVAARLWDFLRSSTDALVNSAYDGRWLLAGNDWRCPHADKVAYSTQLSAIIALEARAQLEADDASTR
ncbi:MAG: glycoside hydrolase [Actinobacteria bacterium]|nr:glycoside hydrolase [Actinomycetota bacterium]